MNNNIRSMTMTTYNAIQVALWQYDNEPDAQNPKKLYTRVNVNHRVLNEEDLPKHFTADRLIDIRLGELLGLGVLGGFYQEKMKKGFNVAVGVDDTMKSQIESGFSDGAIVPMGEKDAMSVQQVSAQAYNMPKDMNIQDWIIKQVQDKEARRSDYPNKCALLVNVYADEAFIDFNEIQNKCNMEAFDMYFFAFYLMPKLQQCRVVHLARNRPSVGVTLELTRDPDDDVEDIPAVGV